MAGGVSMWPSITAADVLGALELERVGSGGSSGSSGSVGSVGFSGSDGASGVVVFRGRNIVSRVPRTLGAQLLAQAVVATERVVPHMAVQTVQCAFPRAGDPTLPVDVRVERLHEGRSVAMLQVGFRQGDNEHCRAIVTLGVRGAELVRHADVLPTDVPGPEDCDTFPVPMLPWEVRTVGGAAALAPELAGPARLDLWMRCAEVPDTASMARAVVAYATEGFLGPVALRPYPSDEIARRGGRAMSVALAQNVTFHDEFSVHGWLLLRCASEFAGDGRMHGRIRVFTRDGRLVASVTADGLMRPGLRP